MNKKETKIGIFVAQRRKELNISRAELAKRCSISSTEIFRIETFERQCPSPIVINKLASALMVDAKDLFALTTDTNDNNTTPVQETIGGLTNPAAVGVVNKLVNTLARNSDLSDEQLKKIEGQIEFIINYEKNNSK